MGRVERYIELYVLSVQLVYIFYSVTNNNNKAYYTMRCKCLENS